VLEPTRAIQANRGLGSLRQPTAIGWHEHYGFVGDGAKKQVEVMGNVPLDEIRLRFIYNEK